MVELARNGRACLVQLRPATEDFAEGAAEFALKALAHQDPPNRLTRLGRQATWHVHADMQFVQENEFAHLFPLVHLQSVNPILVIRLAEAVRARYWNASLCSGNYRFIG